MNAFYTITLVIATIFLILILTLVGVVMSFRNNSSVYPPMSNTCPDYWTVNTNGTCQIASNNIGNVPKCNGGSTNPPGCTGSTGWSFTSKTPGLSGQQIDFKDSGWGGMGKTTLRAQRQWANTNQIEWDGVSNFNGC